MELTNATLDELRVRQNEIAELIVNIDQGFAPSANREELINELNLIGNKISEIEYANKQAEVQQQIAEEHVALVEEAKAQTSYLLDSLEIEGLSISQLSASSEAYDILREGLQLFIDQREQSALDKLKQAKEDSAAIINELKLEVEQLTKENNNQSQTITQLKVEALQAGDTINDLEDKRRAAAIQLDEYQVEIARLNSQIDDLRAEIALGAKAATQIINTSEDLKAKADAFKKSIQDSLIPIYNKRWETEQKKDFYLAELAETGETVRFNWMTEKKYKEVTPAEAATFRAEREAAKQMETDSVGPVEVEEQPVTESPQFQTEETTEPELAEEFTGVEMAGEAVTRSEFEKLKAEFYEVKARVFGN